MENQTLRKYYGMNAGQSGVLVTKINPLSSVAYFNGQPVLKSEDVLMEIDGVKVADDGTISFRGTERIGFLHLFGAKYAGDKCKFKVLRDSQVLEVETILQPCVSLVPKLHEFDSFASYFIVGGLVFCPLSVPFLEDWYGSSWQSRAPPSLLRHFFYGLPSPNPPEEGPEQIVILVQILASPITVGYPAGGWCMSLNSFNGVPIRNMKHLVNLVEDFIAKQSKISVSGTGTSEPADGADSSAQDGHHPPAEQNEPALQAEGIMVESESNQLQLESGQQPKCPTSSFLRFDLGEKKHIIVLDLDEVVRQEATILATHSIAHPKSKDLY